MRKTATEAGVGGRRKAGESCEGVGAMWGGVGTADCLPYRCGREQRSQWFQTLPWILSRRLEAELFGRRKLAASLWEAHLMKVQGLKRTKCLLVAQVPRGSLACLPWSSGNQPRALELYLSGAGVRWVGQ